MKIFHSFNLFLKVITVYTLLYILHLLYAFNILMIHIYDSLLYRACWVSLLLLRDRKWSLINKFFPMVQRWFVGTSGRKVRSRNENCPSSLLLTLHYHHSLTQPPLLSRFQGDTKLISFLKSLKTYFLKSYTVEICILIMESTSFEVSYSWNMRL